MTLREFLKVAEVAPAATLDQPMRIKFEVFEPDGSSTLHTHEVTDCGSNSENCYIGPSGILTESELREELKEEDVEEDVADDYSLYIPKHQLLLEVPSYTKPSPVPLVNSQYVPHMKVERE